jgi:hypothetical protein
MLNKKINSVEIALKKHICPRFFLKKFQGVEIITKKNVDTNGYLSNSSKFQNIKIIYYQTCISMIFFLKLLLGKFNFKLCKTFFHQ